MMTTTRLGWGKYSVRAEPSRGVDIRLWVEGQILVRQGRGKGKEGAGSFPSRLEARGGEKALNLGLAGCEKLSSRVFFCSEGTASLMLAMWLMRVREWGNGHTAVPSPNFGSQRRGRGGCSQRTDQQLLVPRERDATGGPHDSASQPPAEETISLVQQHQRCSLLLIAGPEAARPVLRLQTQFGRGPSMQHRTNHDMSQRSQGPFSRLEQAD